MTFNEVRFSGEKLRQMRLARGRSQRDLPVAHDTISRIESGRRQPHPSTLRKLAEALGVEVSDFFEEVGETPKAAPRLEVFYLPGLDAALRRHGMRRNELAFRVGLTPGELLDYEVGARKPAEETINRLADALGASPRELVFPPKQVEQHLAEEERDNQRINEELAEKGAGEIREELLQNPATRLVRDGLQKNEDERQDERDRKDKLA